MKSRRRRGQPNTGPKPEPEPEEVLAPETPVLRLLVEVLIHPQAAFREILARDMLGEGLAVAAVAGLMVFAAQMVNILVRHTDSPLALLYSTPVSSVADAFITGFLLWAFSRLVGGRGRFLDVLTVAAWSLVIMIIINVAALFGPAAGSLMVQVGMVWQIIILAVGLCLSEGLSVWRAVVPVVLYLVAYGGLALAGTAAALVIAASQNLAVPIPSAAGVVSGPSLSWLGALALIIALLTMDNWRVRILRAVQLTAALAVAISAFGTWFIVREAPFRKISDGLEAYSAEVPDAQKAVRNLAPVHEVWLSDWTVSTYLAHSLALAGDYAGADRQYESLARLYPDTRELATLGEANVDYLQGNYHAAAAKLRNIVDDIPRNEYGEVQARLALAEMRLGNNKQAISAAEAARGVVYKGYLDNLVLAQIYTRSGDTEKAQGAIRAIARSAPEVVKRFEDAPGGWANAAENLTPADLRLQPRVNLRSAGRK